MDCSSRLQRARAKVICSQFLLFLCKMKATHQEAKEVGLHFHVRPRVSRVEPSRRQRTIYIRNPFGIGDRAMECDDDVSLAQPNHSLIVRGHHVLYPSRPTLTSTRWGCCVYLFTDLVPRITQPHLVQQAMLVILAVQVPFRVGVEIKSLVACFHEFPVTNDLVTEKRVQGFNKVFPVVEALNFSPTTCYI
ncbi:Unknown protein [Striga hermonthica]|uniref:Uncharacterized protein n=1 Tax=Striga hermonthica TaxID=68872 RepID=A0A9N7MNT3_STRHE|nr:Unknown protein [Striga hermonthica]